MKKMAIAVLIMPLFFSCQVAWHFQDQHNIEQFGTHETYYCEDFYALDSFDKIYDYIKERVVYCDDPEVKDPAVILADGKASCGGFAVLFSNIAYVGMGIKMDFAIVESYMIERAILAGGFTDHAELFYSGRCFSPQLGYFVEYSQIGYVYSFDSIFPQE